MKKKKRLKRRVKKPTKPLALNTLDAATYLGCSEALLRKMRSLGEGPAYSRVGKKRIVYPIPELKNYLKNNLFR